MEKLVLPSNFIILPLFSLVTNTKRRTFTDAEYAKYEKIFFQKYRNKNIYYGNYDESLQDLYDRIYLSEDLSVIHLKPMYSAADLQMFIDDDLYPLLQDQDLIATFNDWTLEDEQNCKPIQELDHKYQLEIMRKLLHLNLELREKERELAQVKGNSFSVVDQELVEAIFEENPDITIEQLEETVKKGI